MTSIHLISLRNSVLIIIILIFSIVPLTKAEILNSTNGSIEINLTGDSIKSSINDTVSDVKEYMPKEVNVKASGFTINDFIPIIIFYVGFILARGKQ